MKLYEEIQRTELIAKNHGFKLTHGRNPPYSPHHYEDGFALVPLNEALPIYSRDAELWFGDLKSIQAYIAGITFAKDYFVALDLINDKKIARKEQDFRNKILLNILKV